MSGIVVFVSHAAKPEVRQTYTDALSPLAQVVFAADLGPAERRAAFASTKVLVTFSPERELHANELESVGHLGLAQCLAAGRDRFPFERFAGVPVAFNPGAASAPIAEHTIALILAAAKNLLPRHQQMVAGEFNQSGVNTRLDGGTAAVVGLGAIGSKVARLLQAFGMKIRAVNRSGSTPLPVAMCRTLARLDEVLDQADVAVISAELNAATKDLIGSRQLALLKPNAILVNVSRAAVVQEDAGQASIQVKICWGSVIACLARGRTTSQEVYRSATLRESGMKRLQAAAAALLLSMGWVGGVNAQAQAYPSKPIRIVVPYGAGGGIDVISRLVGERLSQRLGQPVLIDNRPGGGTLLGAEQVAKSVPDGYTLMVTTDSTMTINPHLYAKLPYDPVKDFAPITQLVFLNQLLLQNPAVPANNLKELIAYAKANPGKLNYGSYGSGSQPHLAMEILKSQAGLYIVHVPYRGLTQTVPATIAGDVQLTFSGAASSLAFIKSGRLKALAVGGKTRLALLPDVPTFTESGFPDVPANAWFGLFAPAATPRDIVMKLHAEVVRILRDPEFVQKELTAKGYELIASTPEEFTAFLDADSTRNARAVKISGAKAE